MALGAGGYPGLALALAALATTTLGVILRALRHARPLRDESPHSG